MNQRTTKKLNEPFKPIKAPARTPKPPPVPNNNPPTAEETQAARDVLRSVLLGRRWDDQGGYVGLHEGKWDFVSASIGQFAPEELDALFAFAGIVPDEIDIVGHCSDCANSDDGHERGYAAPCSSCLRPSHINNFVPREKLTRRSR